MTNSPIFGDSLLLLDLVPSDNCQNNTYMCFFRFINRENCKFVDVSDYLTIDKILENEHWGAMNQKDRERFYGWREKMNDLNYFRYQRFLYETFPKK